MERKRIEKLVALLLIGILMPVSLFPFSVHADTIDSHIRGRNYTYEPITYNEIQVSSNTYYENIGVFHITFELDDEYIGYVLPNYTLEYDTYFYGASSPYWGTLSKTFDRRIFVNGSSFSFDITVNWNSININTAPGGDPFNYDSYIITSSDVTKYADIDSLDQIINILDNLYNSNDQVEGLLNDQLTQLQLIVSNTSLANTYLNSISRMRQYNMPIESWRVNVSPLSNKQAKTFQNISYWNYPVYDIASNELVFTEWNAKNHTTTFIFGTSKNISETNLSSYFSFSHNFTINFIDMKMQRVGGYKFIRIDIVHSTNATFDITSLQPITNFIYVYAGDLEEKYISTEFALQWGLSNRLLDNLDIIANGTQQSSSASGSLYQTTSQFSDDANDLVTIEETFNDSMNNSLENVSPVFNMGSSFLTSANWVSQQFNRIVNNTPFASLITFGLTLGLGLLIIGKVRK